MAEAEIDTAFRAALDAGKINGAVLCATDSHGRFTYNKALGERTLLSGDKKPQQLDDVLFVASATKFIATVAAMACVDDGLVSLTEDLSSIAPELASRKVLTGFSEDGKTPLLEDQARPITLEMLVSHSSGLTYHFLDPKIARWKEMFPAEEGARKNVEELFNYPLSFQPGEGWMYGPGMDWAGRIVERLTGKTLCDYLHERVFGLVGVTDAEFYPVTREDLRGRLVDLNPEDPDALGRAVLGGGGDMNLRTKGDFGGHGLFITGPGYLRVLRSLLANDGKILKPATADSMFEHRLGPNATASEEAALAGPIGPFFRVGVDQDSKTGHGLGGLLTLRDVPKWYGDRTLTWGGGLTFTWFIDRQNDLCGIAAVQAKLPTDVEVASSLKDTFRHDIYRKRASWKEKVV
ncbi:hypothetical protein N3K66_002570 [Trichothecium roseum]|uniref:Uncharacterized protein n=1 Tax=Trichothecium roseum TaxID=47278 RepID=A0ACC0VCN3_9HYPO|nr:hypothetical protein N3K66_002570 [Trichothecium roseum]